MKIIVLLFFVITVSCLTVNAGDTLRLPLKISIINNGTKFPGGGKLGFFTVPVHPGIVIGSEYMYNKNEKKQLFQTANIGYFYHRDAQHAIQLYTEFGYRYNFDFKLFLETKLGVGYLHSIPATEVYRMNEIGEYEKAGRWGRPQFMLPAFSIGAGYKFKNGCSVFFDYQFWLQLPFVKQYVPLLPNTTLHLGAAIPLIFKK